jgi:hypothetical protein
MTIRRDDAATRLAGDERPHKQPQSAADERILCHLLVEEDSDLIQTQRYWWIRTVDTSAVRLIPAILAEIEARERALVMMRDALAREHARWERPTCTLAVPDTNML